MFALVDLLLPRECAGCGRPATLWCGQCAAQVDAERAFERQEVAGLPAQGACRYAGPVRSLLIAHKEHGQAPLARPLGKLLARSLAELACGTEGPVLMVPVPSAPGADRRRGFHPLGEIARVAAAQLRRWGTPALVTPVAVPVRRRSDQVGLAAAARRANLNGSIAARPLRRAGSVFLVDDILTSGATLSELARALRTAGVSPVGAAVIAVARPDHP